MSLAEAFDAAHVVELILDGKTPIAPILADLEETVAHAKLGLNYLAAAIRRMQAINDKIVAARKSDGLPS